VPAALSNSTFLQDLSGLPGNTNLVGSPASTSSLGLANSYTISLFTFCGTSCSGKFGFHFNPLTDLKLDTTALQGSFSSSFTKTLSSYASTAWFLGIAYVLAFLLNFSTMILSCLGSPLIPAITSSLTTFFLLTASGSGVGVFTNVRNSFNSALSSSGIKTTLGNKLFILSWIATILSLIASILSCIHASRSKSRRQRGGNGLLQDNVRGMDKRIIEDREPLTGSKLPGMPGFLKKIPTWNRHQYTPIEERTAIRGRVYNGNDAEVLLTRGFGGGDEDELEEQDLGQNERIQMRPLVLPNRSRSTSYEQFRGQ